MASPKKTATGKWNIQIEVAGHRESGTFPTKREADAWADRRSTELRAEKTAKPGSTKTLRDALRRYAEEVSPTKRGKHWELIRLTAFEGHPLPILKRLGDITTSDLAEWRDKRLKLVGRGTVLRDLTLLSSVFEISRKEWGWIAVNPTRDVGRPANPDHREVLISGPEIRSMLRQLGWRRGKCKSVSHAVANAFLLALLTGMRAGEICALTQDRIHKDYCTLATSKTGKGRDVPLTPTALRVCHWMKGFDTASLFGISSQTLDALFRRAREKSQLQGFVFHDSRHTAATRLAQKLHILDLCRVFGWSSTSRALTYYNPKVSDIAKRLGAPIR